MAQKMQSQMLEMASPQQSSWKASWVGGREAILAFFLLSGTLKDYPFFSSFPFDITVISAALVGILMLWDFHKRGQKLQVILPIFLFFMLWLPTLLWTVWTPYATDKASRFFTITLIAFFAPAFLIRTQSELTKLLNIIAAMSILVLFVEFYGLVVAVSTARDTVVWSNIILGRTVSTVVLWSVNYLQISKPKREMGRVLAVLGLLAISIPVILSTGSRGPLFSTVFALCCLVFFQRRFTYISNFLGAILFTGVVFILLTNSQLDAVLIEPLQRISMISSSDDYSSQIRSEAYSLSLDQIIRAPLGLGLGGYENNIRLTAGHNIFYTDISYPHDIFLEVLLEGSWLTGIYFSVLFFFVIYKAYRLAKNYEDKYAYQLLFLFLIAADFNALVSSDLNGNRYLFALFGIVIGLEFAPKHGLLSSTPS